MQDPVYCRTEADLLPGSGSLIAASLIALVATLVVLVLRLLNLFHLQPAASLLLSWLALQLLAFFIGLGWAGAGSHTFLQRDVRVAAVVGVVLGWPHSRLRGVVCRLSA